MSSPTETDKNTKNNVIIKKLMQSEKLKIDFANIKILDRASSDLNLQYKEMLYIRKMNPSFNLQMNSELFSLVRRNPKNKRYLKSS